jgi:Protein of unknown function (DUF3352)
VSAPRVIAVLACAVVGAPVLAGCGGGGGSDVDVGPAAAVPADTPVYFEATVRPTGAAEQGARAAASKILDTPDPGAKLIDLISKSAQADEKPGETFNWQQDVEPWLGQRIGIFYSSLSNSDTTAVAESKDNAAAIRALEEDRRVTGEKRDYKGTEYEVRSDGQVFGAVGDFIVQGPEDGFKAAVDALDGDSLGDSGDFKDAVGDLPDDSVGALYAVPKTFLDALPADQTNPQTKALIESAAGDSLDQPVVGDVTASADSIDLELSAGTGGVETPPSALLEAVPGQAWLGIGLSNLGDALKNGLEQLKSQGIPGVQVDTIQTQIEQAIGVSADDLAGALGDASIYVQGTSEKTLGGALVIQTDDPSVTSSLITKLQGLLTLGGGARVVPLSGGGRTGFRLIDRSGSLNQPVEFVQSGDKVVIGYGADSAAQALAGGQTLAANPSFTAAKGKLSDLGVDFFLSFAPVFKLAESSGAKQDPGYVQAKPYIDALDYLALGTGTSGDRAELKFVLGLK